MGKACLRKRNTAPSPALIKPAFPAASILKITSGFLLKDKEACNSIIGLKLKKKKKSLMFVLRLKTVCKKRRQVSEDDGKEVCQA